MRRALAGIVDQHVQGAEAFHCLGDDALAIGLHRDVAGDRCGSAGAVECIVAATSANTTFAPARARPSAMARPSPRAAPVTIATLPSRRMWDQALITSRPGIVAARARALAQRLEALLARDRPAPDDLGEQIVGDHLDVAPRQRRAGGSGGVRLPRSASVMP